MAEQDETLRSEGFSFSDDSPRRDPWTEDGFGYRPFAQRLADVLWDLSAPTGYVLGLHGVWGGGKTTALNFIVHFLNAKNQAEPSRAVEIVQFSPWMFTGRHELISAFFRVLAEALKGGENRCKVRTAARTTAKAVVDPTVKAAVTLAAAAYPPHTAAIYAGGALAKTAMEQTIDAWLGEPTLQRAHQDLVSRLRNSSRRFIVFVDDIDRLERAEVRAIMQMVKSVGQLPNVIYVLAYDRRIVWRSLDESELRQGGEPTSTDKIIQHELELPHAGRSALLRRLDSELSFVFNHVESSARWGEIVRHGFYRWIRSPRDIVRLSNALRFTWPPLSKEVDAADVVAMESLRLFDPKVFEWVRSNGDFLVHGEDYVSVAENKAYAAAFRESLDPALRADVIELLSALFPSKSSLLRVDDRFSFGETWAQTVSRRGIGSPKGFDAYFSLFPSDHVIPKALVDQAGAAPDNDTVQTAALARAIAMVDERKESLVGDYIDELRYRQLSGGMASGKAMLKAFIKRAAFIQALRERNGVSLGTEMHIFLRQILAGWEPKAAGEALLEAVGDDTPAEVLATLWVWRAREARLLPAEGAQIGDVIDKVSLKELGRRTLAAIKAERDSSLANAPYYGHILRSWSALGSAPEARAWLTATANADPRCLAKVARGILSYSRDGERRRYFLGDLGSDHVFYDLKVLLTASEAFAAAPGLEEDETARIVALRDGLRAMRAAQKAKIQAKAQPSDGQTPRRLKVKRSSPNT